jgi:hypothetical protein
MLRLNWASTFERNTPKRSPKVLWTLLLVACPLLWTGCAGISQGSTRTATQQISLPAALPTPSLGNDYHAVLSVTGGLAPYRFALSRGELPAGLTLDPASGSISGTPTRAATFSFSVEVAGQGASGEGAYSVTVDPCVQCVSVQISPASASVAIGGTIQFTAAVRNTSNTAVKWTTTAGIISANGLLSAPLGSSAKSITVTAISLAATAVRATAQVTIASSTFEITTSKVPSAIEATPYSASLDASGGQRPYQWGISSGSLPPGLKLASGGAISGSAIKSGTFNFTVRGADAASHSAERNLSLVVSTSGRICGPPAYDCSRSDREIVQLPKTPPAVGNLSGANTIVTDPDFGNRIVRVTDANTNPDPLFRNRTFVTAGSGSADDNLWNTDSTLFIVEDSGANGYPFTFDPSTLHAARMYASSYRATNGLTIPFGGTWSRVRPNILYTYSGTSINQYDFTDRNTPPSPKLVYDFSKSRNCLPLGFKQTWSTIGGVSADDTIFGMAYSNTGSQGTGVYAVAYKAGSGCSVLNTRTGQVTGDWGAKGAINIPDRWTIHNAKISKDGNWLIITNTACTSSTCSAGPYFWQIGTTTVNSCGDGGSCGGHYTEGYEHWINNDNSPMSNQVIRSFSRAASTSNLTHTFPPHITIPLDQHQSWNNVDPGDTLPFFSSTWSTLKPFPAPWYNEIIAVAADGSGKTWRFAHTFITTRSQRFSTANAIGTISQDGRFFILSSDWMGTLGSESGKATCTIGKDCRGDVFVVEVR